MSREVQRTPMVQRALVLSAGVLLGGRAEDLGAGGLQVPVGGPLEPGGVRECPWVALWRQGLCASSASGPVPGCTRPPSGGWGE